MQTCITTYKKKAEIAREKNEIILCSLIMDDIAIRKQVKWYKNEYVGYINLGKQINDTDLPKASSVVVLMVVGINSHWKVPVAYYFINSLNSIERADIVNDTLTFLHETGVLVTSITFDGLLSHFVMATQCKIKH